MKDKPKHERPIYIQGLTISTPRDLIEVMRNYDIRRQTFPYNRILGSIGEGIEGLACDDEKTIYLNNESCNDSQRLTTIHESLHCHSYLNSLALTEREVYRESLRLFEQWYGHKFGRDNYKG